MLFEASADDTLAEQKESRYDVRVATIFLGLGSNVGDRRRNLKRALAHLPPAVYVEKRSSIYESEPMYEENQPRFYNMVIQGNTKYSPHALLLGLKKIEHTLGREPGSHNLPRVIDLDILFYEDLVLDTPELTIPHLHLHERPFVLVPLMEIAPLQPHPARANAVVADLHADIAHKLHTVWPAQEQL